MKRKELDRLIEKIAAEIATRQDALRALHRLRDEMKTKSTEGEKSKP